MMSHTITHKPIMMSHHHKLFPHLQSEQEQERERERRDHQHTKLKRPPPLREGPN